MFYKVLASKKSYILTHSSGVFFSLNLLDNDCYGLIKKFKNLKKTKILVTGKLKRHLQEETEKIQGFYPLSRISFWSYGTKNHPKDT